MTVEYLAKRYLGLVSKLQAERMLTPTALWQYQWRVQIVQEVLRFELSPFVPGQEVIESYLGRENDT